MNPIQKSLVLLIGSLIISSCSNVVDNHNTFVSIKTTLGVIKVRLYDETPLHRDNFIKLVNSQYYEGLIFHRVIKDFMIQGGDGSTRPVSVNKFSDTLEKYTLRAEFQNQLFHKKGALAAARQGNEVNPEMRSSGTQFYIVQGVRYTDAELDQAENRINDNIKQAHYIKLLKELSDSNRVNVLNMTDSQIQEKATLRLFDNISKSGEYKIPEYQRNIYKSIGGTPRLDGTYTVFGEVIDGLDVVDKIAGVKTNESDKPLTDIKIIRMKIVRK